MSGGAYGIPWRIDGPSPQAPLAGSLLAAARVVDDVDASGIERWGNGVRVYPFPAGFADVHDPCSSGTDRIKAEATLTDVPDVFGAMNLYFTETCSALGITGPNMTPQQVQDRFTARGIASFGAIESAAIEREFMDGAVLGANPHLADGNGNIHAGGAVDVVEAFAWLEEEIAGSGRAGMIHVTPGLATKAKAARLIELPGRDGIIRTVMGTPVVAGYGYVGVTQPDSKPAPADATQSYAFATGPVEIRRSETFLIPERFEQAHDRETNTVTYEIERLYMVDWDVQVQSAVLVDRNS